MLFEFQVAGDKLISRNLLRVGARAVDARPAFKAVADYMIDETEKQFASEGGHASGGWAHLKPITLAGKARRGEDPRILHATHRLVDSLTDRGSADMILETTADELRYGSRVPYAAFHQRGTSSMPRRRPIEFTEPAKRNIVKIIQRWVIAGEVVSA